MVIGAYNEDLSPTLQDAGRVYLFDGKTGDLLRTLTSPHPEYDGHFGITLTPTPDITGDGKMELAIAAPEEDPPGGALDGGRVYIVDPTNGKVLQELASPRISTLGNFGYSMVAGDIGLDSGPVILVGANRERVPSDALNSIGGAYLFSLTQQSLLLELHPPGGFTPRLFGWASAICGDYDADGIRDLLVTDLEADSAGDSTSKEGAAFIFSGRTGDPLAKLTSPNRESLGGFGYSAAAIPDINGDGVTDYAIGADAEDPGNSPVSAGRVYLFSGPDTLIADLKSPFQKQFGAFGQAILGLPDLDEDGVGDILIGAPGENLSGGIVSGGTAYLFSGYKRRAVRVYSSEGSNVGGGLFGMTLASPGDLNGDGNPDLLIGAQWETPPGSRRGFAGRAYTLDSDTGESLPPGTTADVAAYLLGREVDPTGMDFNDDQGIDAADLVRSALTRP